MRELTIAELDREIAITERDLEQLKRQRAELEPKLTATERVLAYMQTSGAVSKAEIIAATGVTPPSVNLALGHLKRVGAVEVVRWGVYAITPRMQ